MICYILAFHKNTSPLCKQRHSTSKQVSSQYKGIFLKLEICIFCLKKSNSLTLKARYDIIVDKDLINWKSVSGKGVIGLVIRKRNNIRWQLVIYDILILMAVDFLLLFIYKGNIGLSVSGAFVQAAVSFVCIFGARIFGNIYSQIWRYGGIQSYIKLLMADCVAFLATYVVEAVLPIEHLTFPTLLSVASLNLIASLGMRMMYRYAYKCSNGYTAKGKFLGFLLHIFAGKKVLGEKKKAQNKIKIAIVGAGSVGVTLADELLNNEASVYAPRCFLDVNRDKVGREINGIPVFFEDESAVEQLKELEIQEIVFAIPKLSDDERKRMYDYYTKAGYKVKLYDYPLMKSAGGKRQLREFDIEELLLRKSVVMSNAKTREYYKDKVILITGGGGSIGSEICRQLAKMKPKKIVVLDIYENGAYDVQQELRIAYGEALDMNVEIASITDRKAMERIFAEHRPQIVINAAAHKHVPLMEHNCIEAVENNVFGTKILVDLCEKYEAERFMMVSTDKAVNPTNVMGATKRMCEMIVLGASTTGKVKYSMTRFGNVLGSAGSVVPLFKRQIANGGPVTITDKRIIRYFMTIPEASQLVLQSGAIAKNGELFVLDMGKPVKIYDLAENMIRLSGMGDIEIVETGLRPGEKLYEELLIDTDKLEKTENKLIFIEKDEPLSVSEIEEKLRILKEACETDDDEKVREALHSVVPTFKKPEEVNNSAKEYVHPSIEVANV